MSRYLDPKADNDWYHHYKIVNVQKPVAEIKDLQLIFVELPKFKTKNYNQKKLQILWLRFMSELDQTTTAVASELLAVPEIKEAVSITEQAAYSPAELDAYDRFWDAVSTEKTLKAGAYAEGKAEGKAETLIQMIKRKFNKSLSKEDEIYVVTKIQQASAEQLTQWVDDVLDAMTLDDLFKMFEKRSSEGESF